LVLEVRSCATDKDQEANHVGYPDVLADKVQAAISDEANNECAGEDYAHSTLDRQSLWPDCPEALSAANRGENAKDARHDDDDYGYEGNWIPPAGQVSALKLPSSS
jgi:hypothetical protein